MNFNILEMASRTIKEISSVVGWWKMVKAIE